MTTSNTINALACAPGALTGGPIRTRFFDGMFLTKADLETEQRYWRTKRRLTNRALGVGVVWGLRLVWNVDRRAFTLSPGYALDCCGNDLVVECQTQVTAAELWSRADPALKAGGDAFVTNSEAKTTRSACVVLQYTECGETPRTAQTDACGVPASSCELSRVRETARLLLVPPPARRATPPEQFLEDLQAFHAGLPSALANAVFPPQTSPGSTPTTASPPVTLSVRAKDGTSSAGDLIAFPPAGTTATGAPITATQAGVTTAVVTFELNAHAGWRFTAGTVGDQNRTVETVSPLSAPSMFWSLDVVQPAGPVATAFTFTVANLAVAETAAGGRSGVVNAEITGRLRVVPGNAGLQIFVDALTIRTKDATVAIVPTAPHGCFDDVFPWGWTVNPADGSRLARVLVIAGWYAFLEEVNAKSSSPAFKLVAQYLYQLMWFALFDANVAADPNGDVLVKLSQLIQKLFERWCQGFAYPGPRCTDEHHGVYLGCAEIDRSGQILSFDMWTNRRYVTTGPLLAHWANQIGVAPIDVIVGRFSDALCCVASKPFSSFAPGAVAGTGLSKLHVGTPGTLADFGVKNHATIRYVGLTELARAAARAFTAKDTKEHELLAHQIPDGATVGVLVPVTAATAEPGTGRPRPKLLDEVTGLIKRPGDVRVIERARPLIAGFVTDMLATAPVSALVPDGSAAPLVRLAEELDARRTTIADLAVDGSAGVATALGGTIDPALAGASDDLVDRAELAVAATTTQVVKVMGGSADRAAFKDARKQQALARSLGAAIPKLDPQLVTAAANRAATA